MTPELAVKRLGKLGASDAATVMGGDATKGLAALVRRKAGERVYGDLGEEGFKSWQMERGNEVENPALDWAEFTLDVALLRQQHIDHATIPNVSATPDGLAPGLFTVEAKSPTFHVYCDTVDDWRNGKRGLLCVPSEYRKQCLWQCWVAGLTEGRFVVFHPAGGGQGIVVPYEITQADRDAMAERVVTVEAMIRNWVEILRG